MGKFLECFDCHKRTIQTEADYRNFNTGGCRYCGGELKQIIDNPQINELRENIADICRLGHYEIAETNVCNKLYSLFTNQLELAKIEAKIEEIGHFLENEDGEITLHELYYDKEVDGEVYGQTISLEDRLSELTNQKDLLTKENK